MCKKNSKNNRKKIIITVGGKGGVGKTTFNMGLADFYLEKGVNVELVDADTGNKTYGSLNHVYPNAFKLDIRSRMGLDKLIELATQPLTQLVLVDMGAGTIDELVKWFVTVSGEIKAAGIDLTLCSILSEELATGEVTMQVAQALQDQADYVVVRNFAKGDPADIERTEAFKKYVEVCNPTFLNMDALRPDVALELCAHGLSPRTALSTPDDKKGLILAGTSARIRLLAWGRRLGEQIIQIPSLLPA
jgi:hypothetical protein